MLQVLRPSGWPRTWQQTTYFNKDYRSNSRRLQFLEQLHFYRSVSSSTASCEQSDISFHEQADGQVKVSTDGDGRPSAGTPANFRAAHSPLKIERTSLSSQSNAKTRGSKDDNWQLASSRSDHPPTNEGVDHDQAGTPLTADSHARSLEAFRAAAGKQSPAILVLSGVSQSLEEGDFRRAAPASTHLAGWSGPGSIIKVWPHRNPHSLMPSDSYFMLFSNPHNARIYQDHVSRLHRLARRFRPTSIESSTIKLPPPRNKRLLSSPAQLPDLSEYADLFQKPARRQATDQSRTNQAVADVLADYALADPSQPLDIRLISGPFRGAMAQMVQNQGYADITRATGPDGKVEDRTGRAVLFSVNGPASWQPDPQYMQHIIQSDGRARCLPWAVTSIEIKSLPMSKLDNPENRARWYERPSGLPREQTKRLLITLQDALEAERFRRVWHGRVWPERSKHGETPLTIVDIVW